MNTLIEIQTTENNKVVLPLIEYQGKKVITTEILAKLYGTINTNIINNFTHNKSRFILGKHYFKVEGAELKEFKDQYVNNTKSISDMQCIVSKNAKSLILWTEEGCIRHAKILETDQAWHVFGLLEKAYFNQQHIQTDYKSDYQLLEKEMKCRMAIEVAKATGEMLRLSDTSKLRMMYAICETYKVDSKFLPYYVEQNPTGSLTDLLKEFNLSYLGAARKINLILEQLGILEKISRKSTSSPTGQKQFWSLTSKGLEFGKNESSAQNPKETQPHYFREKFLDLIKLI